MPGRFQHEPTWEHDEFPGKPPSPLDGSMLTERAIAEGNILEYPIFKLSNKEARPYYGRDEQGNPLYREQDYKFAYEYLEPGEAGPVQRRVEIEVDMHSGFPTMFAYNVLIVILEKFAEDGFRQPRVPITRYEICRRLGMTKFAGAQYGYIDDAVRALSGLKAVFTDAWVDFPAKAESPPPTEAGAAKRARGKTHTGVRLERIIKDYQFQKESERQPQLPNLDSWVELGTGILNNLRNGYRIGQDLAYLNELREMRAMTAMRLYAYLSKKDASGRRHYEENVGRLAKKLPLSSTKIAELKRILVPALNVLAAPMVKLGGRRFLQEHYWTGSGSDTKLNVVFFNPKRHLEELDLAAVKRSSAR